MNEHTLSQRLARVAAHVPNGARLADIGSDHAYLPVALLRAGRIEAAVAGEVAATPFQAAERTVRDSGLAPQISVRLADGLAAIEAADAITAISLCGMGGETIRDILDAGKARLNGHERLILQPNGGEQPLRVWLMQNGYRIVSEEVLHEQRFYYEIIVAEPTGPVAYTEEQLYFGPLQLQARTPVFLAKWQRALRLRRKTLASFEQARQAVPQARVQEVSRQIQWMVQLLSVGASSLAKNANDDATILDDRVAIESFASKLAPTHRFAGAGYAPISPLIHSPGNPTMADATDQAFYDRADAHIELSNEQLKTFENLGQVSASMMFGTTRFNAWACARNFKSGAHMAEEREALLKYFCDQYRMMLEDNLDDHINQFDAYRQVK